MGVSFLHQFAFAQMFIAYPLLMQARFTEPEKKTALSFMLLALAAAVGQGLLAGRLLRRFGSARVWVAFASLTAALAVFFPFITKVQPMFALLMVWALCFSLTNPPLLTWVGLLSPSEHKGLTAGAAESANGAARILGNVVSGALIAWFGAGGPFFVCALAMAAAMSLGSGLQLLALSNRSKTSVG
jgi:MFS family permease